MRSSIKETMATNAETFSIFGMEKLPDVMAPNTSCCSSSLYCSKPCLNEKKHGCI